MNQERKLISVVVPLYNEVSMIEEVYTRIEKVFAALDDYDYEIVFFDDGSTDGSRTELEKLCAEHEKVKCVFYTRNFGYLKNTFYSVQQAQGDCAVIIHADLQNPPEMIPEFIKKWEEGAQVVQGVKSSSHENKAVYFLRTLFYFLMIHFFGMNITAHATEFALFDKSFIEILKRIKVNNPFLRGFIGEYASNTACVYYVQDARRKGKSKFSFNKYYDFMLCGITQCSHKLPRKVIVVCLIALLALAVEFFFGFLPKTGSVPFNDLINSILVRCTLFVLCLLTIVVCILFEYLITALNNTAEKPLIVEEKRIHYDPV